MITERLPTGSFQNVGEKGPLKSLSVRNERSHDSPASFAAMVERKMTNASPVSGKDLPVRKSDLKDPSDVPKSLSERQKMMQEFMDSVESEFSIPPEKFLGAISKLNSNDLQKTPEETASQVIQQMQLPDKVAEKLEGKYLHLLTKLSEAEPAPAEPLKALLTPVPIAVATLQLVPVMQLVPVINLNEVEDSSPLAMDPQLLQNQDQSALNFRENFTDMPRADILGMDEDLLQSLDGGKELPVEDFKELPTVMSPILPQTQEIKELAGKLAALGVTAGALNKAIQADPQNQLALHREAEMVKHLQGLGNYSQTANMLKPALDMSNGQRALQTPTPLLNTAGLAGLASAGQHSAQDSMEQDGSGTDGDSGLTAVSADGKDAQAAKTTFASTLQESFKPGSVFDKSLDKAGDKSTDTQNLQKIMDQAQYTIRKGGGEAVVKMNPEGLGDVHLKVVVSEGKVSVQMTAETKEAKSLIESSLRDLKMSLGTHNLKVDHVKVDVGNQASSDRGGEQRGNSGMNQAQDRSANSNGNSRNAREHREFQSMFTPGQHKSVGHDVNRTAFSGSRNPAKTYFGEGRGTGLNLVA